MQTMEARAQARAFFASRYPPPPRTNTGCTLQYVNDRHTHSTGPIRNHRNHNGLYTSCAAHTPATNNSSSV